MTARMFTVSCLLGFASTTAVHAGPLGLTMSQTLAQTKILKVRPKNIYLVSVPNPLPGFEQYLAKIGRTTGLCKISAIGKSFQNDSYGIDVSAEYDRLMELLVSKYGKYKNFDFLRAGSIWDEPKDWSMSILKKERIKTSFWDRETGANLPHDISSIELDVKSVSFGSNYVTITYEFSNFQRCLDEDRQAEKNAL